MPSSGEWTRKRSGKQVRFEEDANNIPIEAVVNYYGGEVRQGRNVSVKCVMHNDSHRSASINTYDNLYFCFTCGQGGNAANVVCIIEGLDFKDGLKRATEIATRSGAEIRPGNKSRNSRRAIRTWDI